MLHQLLEIRNRERAASDASQKDLSRIYSWWIYGDLDVEGISRSKDCHSALVSGIDSSLRGTLVLILVMVEQ